MNVDAAEFDLDKYEKMISVPWSRKLLLAADGYPTETSDVWENSAYKVWLDLLEEQRQ